MARTAEQERELAEWRVRRSPLKAARYAARLARSADAAEREEAAAIVAALKLANRCTDCGRPLEDLESRARGFGPDCAEKRRKAAS